MNCLRWISLGVLVASLVIAQWPGQEPKIALLAIVIGALQALLVLFALEHRAYRQRRKEAQAAQALWDYNNKPMFVGEGHSTTMADFVKASVLAPKIQAKEIVPQVIEAVSIQQTTITQSEIEAASITATEIKTQSTNSAGAFTAGKTTPLTSE